MLNITGGGLERFKKENNISYMTPEKIFALDADPMQIKQEIAGMFR